MASVQRVRWQRYAGWETKAWNPLLGVAHRFSTVFWVLVTETLATLLGASLSSHDSAHPLEECSSFSHLSLQNESGSTSCVILLHLCISNMLLTPLKSSDTPSGFFPVVLNLAADVPCQDNNFKIISSTYSVFPSMMPIFSCHVCRAIYTFANEYGLWHFRSPELNIKSSRFKFPQSTLPSCFHLSQQNWWRIVM